MPHWGIMKVSGTATLNAPREDVWRALNDPEVLVRTIPGCQQLETIEQDAYRMTLTAGVASIKGVYQGEVRLEDQEHPGSFTLKAAGAGAPGTVSADVKVTLSDGPAGTGTTLLNYDADAIVGGMIGGVGQRMLSGVAKKTAGEFFGNVDDVLTGVTPAAAGGGAVLGMPAARGMSHAVGTPGADTSGPGEPGTGGERVGGVFRAPAAQKARTTRAADFRAGVVVGAAAALLGAVVGGWLSGRRRA
jgi:carbon monoxide dehydrogenase subunit G